MIGQPASRPQLQSSDVKEPEQLRKVLNQTLLELCARLEALEAAKGVYVLPEVRFETGGAVSPTDAPFASGGVRVTCPFSPTGLVLLRLQVERPASQAISSLPSDVKWHFGAGPQAGDGLIIIDYVTGLLTNTSYRMRLGVTRA